MEESKLHHFKPLYLKLYFISTMSSYSLSTTGGYSQNLTAFSPCC